MYFIGDEEIEALKKLFAKKKLYRYQSSYLSECDLFEKEFSEFTAAAHSLILSSGTNALMVSLLAAGIQPGDEVLVPTYTFIATAAAVVQAGAIPVLVDINENLSLEVSCAKAKLSDRTKALILVHMDGLVADVIRVKKFCDENSLILIEDVAQAIGASCENKKLGSFGAFGCFSLNENKNISCGEGGVIITNDRRAYEKAFCLHDTPAQFNPTKKDFFSEISPFLGFSMRVSEIQGAIMRVQLKRLDYILAELRKRKWALAESLRTINNVALVEGYSSGECASALHLQFADPDKINFVGKKLRDAGFLFTPVTMRPAHASWKWSHLLGEKSHLQAATNPFLRTDRKYSYHPSQFLQSVEILMRTMKMEVEMDLSVDETKIAGQKMKKIIENA